MYTNCIEPVFSAICHLKPFRTYMIAFILMDFFQSSFAKWEIIGIIELLAIDMLTFLRREHVLLLGRWWNIVPLIGRWWNIIPLLVVPILVVPISRSIWVSDNRCNYVTFLAESLTRTGLHWNWFSLWKVLTCLLLSTLEFS